MFEEIANLFRFILELPEFVEEIRGLLYLIKDLLIIFVVLLGLQFISLFIFILMWFNANLYNYEGKFDFKLILHKYRRIDDQKKREEDIKVILEQLSLTNSEEAKKPKRTVAKKKEE